MTFTTKKAAREAFKATFGYNTSKDATIEEITAAIAKREEANAAKAAREAAEQAQRDAAAAGDARDAAWDAAWAAAWSATRAAQEHQLRLMLAQIKGEAA